MYTAEVWLVHTVPNRDTTETRAGGRRTALGTGRGGAATGRSSAPASEAGPGEHEETTYQVVRFPATGAGFVMAPVSIETTRGTASIVVMGTLSAQLENGLPTKLVVTLNRHAMCAGQPETRRSSTKEMAWPPAGEVISFELPPTARDTQEKLAIRLRITSGAGRGTRIR
jgi:hypothetical protein